MRHTIWNRQYEAFLKAKSEDDPDYTVLGLLLFDAIEKFTEQNDRLLDLLVEFWRVPDCNGAFHKFNGLTEYLVEVVFDCQGWVNTNTFTAKLYNTSILPQKHGQLQRASGVLRKTLETALWEVFPHEDIEDYLDSLQDSYVEYYDGKLDEEYKDRRDRFLEEINIETLNG
ncbi:hypothetical protein ABOM_011139 [Aspergillus bombycis]|uniref:Uncharacterized protein n=1 Tax=Aspergillus bombycis TaxID=109264 RepID=A0A1F7ZMT4_9EURO|nr:hypothetical protein ABOM_011139 [Aspergillus bombycis]OGM40767.1 hypothetical protein ABOM_011139 [Aspergillus bombycis]